MIGVARVEAPPARRREHDARRGRRRSSAATRRFPRLNGELVFDEVWHGRALGMGVVVLERLGLPWSAFRDHLVAAIERHGQPEGESAAEAYYVAFLDAIESLVAALSLAASRCEHGRCSASCSRSPPR